MHSSGVLFRYDLKIVQNLIFGYCMQTLQSPIFRILSWLIKIAIVIAAAFYIYQKVFLRKDSLVFSGHIQASFHAHRWLFVSAFLLLFVNWALEAFKWKLLLRKIIPITFFKSFRSILAGVTTGVFTPNRAGEFGGRVFDLEEGHRMEAALLSFAGGLIQLSVTILAALPAIFMDRMSSVYLGEHIRLSLLLLVITLGLCAVLWCFKDRIAPKAKPFFRLFPAYPWLVWLKVFVLSFFRYAVFSFQFYLLLKGFGIELSAGQACLSIPLTFFAGTVIPTFALSEIAVRGSVSVLFIGVYSADSPAILSASFLLWIINIALPALAGSIFVLRINPFTKLESK